MQAASSLFPILLMFGVFYFVMIRPQVKKQRQHQAMLQALQQGDEVITRGGFIGKVSGIAGDVLTIELQEKVRVRVLRSHVDGKYAAPATAASGAGKTASAGA